MVRDGLRGGSLLKKAPSPDPSRENFNRIRIYPRGIVPKEHMCLGIMNARANAPPPTVILNAVKDL